MKIIHEYRSYDSNDCTATGYLVQLRSDGSIRTTHRSCWQGSRSGQTYLTGPGEIELPTGDDAPDADTILAGWPQSATDLDEAKLGRRIRRGCIVS